MQGKFTDAQAERWWEHYIAVKLDLVQNVLQDDVADDADADAARSPLGTAACALSHEVQCRFEMSDAFVSLDCESLAT